MENLSGAFIEQTALGIRQRVCQAAEIMQALATFEQGDDLHAHSLASRRESSIILTAGAAYLREAAGCDWLFDLIASVKKIIDDNDRFVVIVLSVHDDRSATFTISADIEADGTLVGEYYRDEIDAAQMTPPFPLPGIRLYYQDGVVMLPGEY